MAKRRDCESAVEVGWDGIVESISGKTGGVTTIIMERKPISERAAAAQAASLKRAAESGAPLCEP